MKANYECLKCDLEWIENTKGGSIKSSHGPTECPQCGNLYVKWINYK